jgi:hypothetical protein
MADEAARNIYANALEKDERSRLSLWMSQRVDFCLVLIRQENSDVISHPFHKEREMDGARSIITAPVVVGLLFPTHFRKMRGKG